jgi:superfamily II DNA or RNA helicase
MAGACGHKGTTLLHSANRKTCESIKVPGSTRTLKVGALAGQKLFAHNSSQKDRDKVIRDLNAGSLHGVIMTDKVGGCGHNIVGANHMIFMGSLYSQSYEDQCVGKWLVMITIN